MTLTAINYDPVTSAVHYDPIAEAVKVTEVIEPGNTCDDCDAEVTPRFIKVTFQNITFVNNGTCYDCATGCKDQSWTGVFDPNTEYILEQVAKAIDEWGWL